ncbi:MAG: iron-containing alcohol dehydrogenase [Burkholderiales bacterium]
MNFDFTTASRIVFGRGTAAKLPKLCAGVGKRFLIVSGRSQIASGVTGALKEGLRGEGLEYKVFESASGEPTVNSVDEAVKAGAEAGVDAVIGIGGGSAMDTAKTAAGIITNGGSVRDYLEGVGTGAKVKNAPLPFIAVPTTSGTGTEVTKNAVVMSREEKFKKSFRDDRLLARIALVDPELTVTTPKSVTASSGMDAICQLIESHTAKQANPFCGAMSLYHTPRAMRAIKRAYDDGQDMDARETMALASLVSGICLANAGLGAAHGIGAGLGAVLGTTHGIACGMMLPHVMRYNISGGVSYADISEAYFSRTFADKAHASLMLADAVDELCAYLGLPRRLGELGVTPEMADELAQASMGSSMSKNPVDIPLEACRDFILSLI